MEEKRMSAIQIFDMSFPVVAGEKFRVFTIEGFDVYWKYSKNIKG